jgi:hypothetical protein
MSTVFGQMNIELSGEQQTQTVTDERIIIHNEQRGKQGATIQMCEQTEFY